MMKKWIISVVVVVFLVLFLVGGYLWYRDDALKKEQQHKEDVEKLVTLIESKHTPFVKTNKEAELYQKVNGKFEKRGKVRKDAELEMNVDEAVDQDTKYLPLKNIAYWISYQDIDPIEALTLASTAYQHYIAFNENAVTDGKTTFYKDGAMFYQLEESVDLPILIKDDPYYYVVYDNQLLGLLKEKVTVKAQANSDAPVAKAIATLNYHFFYDDDSWDECGQSICLHVDRFRTHLDYFKEEGYYTLRMHDMELFIDGKIQLPEKSVLITIDDGWLAEKGIAILNEYQMNATLFLMTKFYDPNSYASQYVEVHSHGDNLHFPGACPGGQGGPIKCYPEDVILADLTLSREKLNGSTAFCYPFYEYNDYSIGLVQKAGFTMAFIGGNRKITVGSDKMRLPRYPITIDMTKSDIANIVSP